MALFGGSRDISLFNTVSKELINDIIQTEIAYYKFTLEHTKTNVYGESPQKNYYEPLKIASLIDRSDQTWSSDEFGPDVNQIIKFTFLRKEFINLNLFSDVGDLILFRNNFYEVDSRTENQLAFGKDPDYALSSETSDFGGNYSITLNTHISRVEKLSLVPLRGGKYPTTTQSSGGEANRLSI
jgi:hypothetical protein|tara:strand:+ start:1266 stop:1814 length:549 start_codon:yes stop_codon:yes gene_type:complete